MSRWISIRILAVAPLALLATQGPPQAPPTQVPDEVLIQFARSAPGARRAAIVAAENSQAIRQFESLDTYHVRLPQGRNVEAAVAAFLRQADVVAAQPNYIR